MKANPSNAVGIEELRNKWQEVPLGQSRAFSRDLVSVSDTELTELLKQHARERDENTETGWYFPVYREALRGKRVLEIGSGIGLDGVTFMKYGANWTFCDISKQNLEFVKRHISVSGLNPNDASFFYIDSFDSFLRLPADYDFIWADGSLLNLPFEDARSECLAIVSRLKAGGRWIELTYPKKRWEREGSLPFSKWGELTDGIGTPWIEWYDTEKLLQRLYPAKMRPLFTCSYYNNSFNWHDLELIEAFDYHAVPPSTLWQLIQLESTESCNKCSIEASNSAIKIETGHDIWSYAALLPMMATSQAKLSCSVVSGSLGVGFVDSSLNFIGKEIIVDAGDDTLVSVSTDRSEDVHGLIFRNTFGSGASVAIVTDAYSL